MKRKATMLLTTMLAVGLTAGQALSATICGFAQNAQGPVSGVTVEVKDASGKVLGTAVTGANGQYSISGLSPGTLDLFIDPQLLQLDALQSRRQQGMMLNCIS